MGATFLNSSSSRSHAIFTIQYTKTKRDLDTGAVLHQASKLNLLDLAGSENATSAGTSGERLKEGGSINKSLLTLGLVIKALAERSIRMQRMAGSSASSTSSSFSSTPRNGGGAPVIPYRDSVLTFLLKDSLGGNSRCVVART